MFLAKLFLPGSRTYTLTGLALVIGVAIQADTQGIITLAPILKMMLYMALTVIAPLIPVFIRKALPKDFRP